MMIDDDWWWVMMMMIDDWWLIDWLIDWLFDGFIDWLVGWLAGCLVGWLVDWLIDDDDDDDDHDHDAETKTEAEARDFAVASGILSCQVRLQDGPHFWNYIVKWMLNYVQILIIIILLEYSLMYLLNVKYVMSSYPNRAWRHSLNESIICFSWPILNPLQKQVGYGTGTVHLQPKAVALLPDTFSQNWTASREISHRGLLLGRSHHTVTAVRINIPTSGFL